MGRPLAEVERYYIEQALQLTGGNREEAARMLGIGERTLYRVIQDWKQQDRIRARWTPRVGITPPPARPSASSRDSGAEGEEVGLGEGLRMIEEGALLTNSAE